MAKELSRRQFIGTSAAAAVALGTAGVARGYPANEKVQLGWIGCGGRSSHLMQLMMNNVPDAKVVGVCDLIPERMEKAKAFWKRDEPNGYLDFRKMFEKEKLDGVMAITQICKHAEVTVPVLEAGYHCFGEKPMDKDVQAVDALTAAARKAWKEKGRFFQIGTQRRYHPTYLTCMKEIHGGLIGKITFMHGGWHWTGDPSGVPTDCDGGRFIEQASHHMDVMAWAMKDVHPVVCVAMASNQAGKPPAFSETHSSTTFQWADGTLLSYTHLWLLPEKYKAETLTVFGEKGAVDLNAGTYHGRDDSTRQLGEASGQDWDKGTIEELADFVANIKTGGKRLPNANVETGRVCSLMCIMARMAMVDAKKNAYEPSVIRWKDLGSTTEPT
jgi:predicted dehydrogenase